MLLFQGLTATADKIKQLLSLEVPSKTEALYQWAIIFYFVSGVFFGIGAIVKAAATYTSEAEERAEG